MNDKELIFSTGKEYLAELFKQVLIDNDIEAFIFNRQDSSYHFGDIEVYINSCDIEKAKQLKTEFENNISFE